MTDHRTEFRPPQRIRHIGPACYGDQDGPICYITDDDDAPALPGLETVRETENPDPAPVAALPPQTFELTAPPETDHTQGNLL